MLKTLRRFLASFLLLAIFFQGAQLAHAAVAVTSVTVSSITIGSWRYGGTTAKLRVYASETFDQSGNFVIGSRRGSGQWYKQVDCTVAGTVLSIPSFALYVTTNSTNANATYTFVFVDSNGTERDVYLGEIKVPDTFGGAVTWSQLYSYNTQRTTRRADYEVYNKDQVNALLLGGVVPASPAKASTTVAGVAKVSVTPLDANDPIAKGANDSTGNLINPGSTTVGADSDANGNGIVDLQTRNLSRLAVDNGGLVGLGTAAPTAFLDISQGNSNGGNRFLRFNNKETAHPDYGVEIHHTPNTFCSFTRPTHSLIFGYNYTTSGAAEIAADESIALVIETPYMTSQCIKQSEWYMLVREPSGSGGTSYRPFGLDWQFELDFILGGMRADSWRVGHKGNGYDWLTLNSSTTSGDMIFDGNSGISFSGTAPFGGSIRSAILTYAGTNILYAKEDLGGSNQRLKFYGGSGGGNDTLNIFAADNTATAVNQTLMFGTAASATQNKSMRWNGTAIRFEYEGLNIDGATTSFRPFNDWAAQIRHYGLARTLGDTAGDFIELGTLANAGTNGDGNIQVEVFSDDLRTYKSFNLTKTNGDASGTWLQTTPSVDGPGLAGDLSVDIRNAGTGGANLRLRRTVTTGFGAQAYTVAIRVLDKLNAFTASSASGSGATVAGIYRWRPITQTPTGVNAISYRSVTPAQITGNQNDYNPGGAAAKVLRLSTDASRNLTGLTFSVAQADGQEHVIQNAGSFNIVLKHQDAGSAAANRFLNSGSVDITLTPLESADLVYDATNLYWRVYKRTSTLAAPGAIGATAPAAGTFTTLNANTSLVVNGGTALTKFLSATASLDFTALAANSCEILTVTVTGAADGDTVSLGVLNALADVDGATERTTFFGWVSAADTVSVRRCNITGTVTADPAAATVRATVTRF